MNRIHDLISFLKAVKNWRDVKAFFKGYLIWSPPIEWFVESGFSREEIAKEEAIKKYDNENGINTCCCNVCMPSDESLDEGCYPFRLCWSGKIVYG